MTTMMDAVDDDGDDDDNVAFPNRKSYIFDNKLEFSGTKLAES